MKRVIKSIVIERDGFGGISEVEINGKHITYLSVDGEILKDNHKDIQIERALNELKELQEYDEVDEIVLRISKEGNYVGKGSGIGSTAEHIDYFEVLKECNDILAILVLYDDDYAKRYYVPYDEGGIEEVDTPQDSPNVNQKTEISKVGTLSVEIKRTRSREEVLKSWGV